MAQTPAERKRAQRARDRARLGDKEYKRVEAEKMKKWRASKRPPKPKKTTSIKKTNCLTSCPKNWPLKSKYDCCTDS